MAALASPDVVAFPIPKHSRLAQSSAGRDDAAVSRGIRRAFLHHREIRRLEMRDSVGVRLKVVQHGDAGDIELRGNLGGIHPPGQVRRFGAPVVNRSGKPETPRENRAFILGQILPQNRTQPGIRGTREPLIADEEKLASDHTEGRDVGLRAADVAGQNVGGRFSGHGRSFGGYFSTAGF